MQRRKVQAQRKFAQGAHILASANTSTPKLTSKIQKDENLVFISTAATTATHLLDILSLKDSHEHLQPIVILERLPGNSTKSPQKKTMPRVQGHITKPYEKMCLRPSTKYRTRQTYKRTNKAFKKKLSKMSLHSANEDETPLLYLKNQIAKKVSTGKKGNKATSLAQKRASSSNNTETTGIASAMQDDISTPKSNKRKKYKRRTAKVVAVSENKINSNETVSESNATTEINDCAVAQTEINVCAVAQTEINVCAVAQTEINVCAVAQTEMNVCAVAQTEVNVCAVAQTEVNTCTTAPTEMLYTTEIEPQPSTSFANIETHYIRKRSNSTDTDITDDVIIIDNFDDDDSEDCSIYPFICNVTNVTTTRFCSSKNFSTVDQVVFAAVSEFTNQCLSCIHCFSIIKVRRIIRFYRVLVYNYPKSLDYRTDSSSENGDLYVFIPENRQTGLKSAITFYINLPTEINSLIELKICWNNSNELQIVSADMVPKTPNIKISNLGLSDNYDLFVDMLNFIKKANIRYYKMVTIEEDPKIESIVISGDESEPECNEIIYTELNEPEYNEVQYNALEFNESNYREIDYSISDYNQSEPDYIIANYNESGSNYIETVSVQSESNEPEVGEPIYFTINPSVEVYKEAISPSPKPNEVAQQVDAPVFYPTLDEFVDPMKYFQNIMPAAAEYGICKVVAPQGFKPQCVLDDSVRFAVTNQYISRLFKRWGSGLKELCAIKAYLASQSVVFNRAPLLDGIEVNLPKLYDLVQNYGGLRNVIARKRWPKIAEEMRLTKTQKIGNRLDKIYVKYILPYDTLSEEERTELMKTVEIHWKKKYQRMLKRALNPLHRQMRLLGESETSEEEVEDDIYVSRALNEAEDCITKGRLMKLSTYQKVALKAAETYLNNSNSKTVDDIEQEYWRIVMEGKEHVCVNSASIDTGEEGYGFTKNQNDIYGVHPWNLKVLSQNDGNVLRSLGPVLGVTVPTLHLGMTFSTSCWHRDPHGLPWIEYMHSGPGKIWYGIPDEQSDNFRLAVEKLCPTACQKKSVWLPSDIVMIPPNLLLEHQVSLSRVVQKPGEYIIVFPKAYSCSISTGYTESESVYFAPFSWLDTYDQIFKELRESCEPSMFSLDQLLLSVARDPRSPISALTRVYLDLERIICMELSNRLTLARYRVQEKSQRKRLTTARKRPAGAWNVREQEECIICQKTLYLSRVWGLTDKKQTVCIQHALELLNKVTAPTRDMSSVGLEIFLSERELGRVISNVHNRIQNEIIRVQ